MLYTTQLHTLNHSQKLNLQYLTDDIGDMHKLADLINDLINSILDAYFADRKLNFVIGLAEKFCSYHTQDCWNEQSNIVFSVEKSRENAKFSCLGF